MRTLHIYAISIVAASLLSGCGIARTDYIRDTDNEVIEVGYGTVVKDRNTHGISKMDINENEKNSYADIFDYLRGRVPGVIVGPSRGGSMPHVQIRGINSINSSTEPLYVVDGMEVMDISYINPNDVESITVLKDSSASIYGVRGACGVILINTKTTNRK